MAFALDWPLSREERKRAILMTYEKELECADNVLRVTGQQQRALADSKKHDTADADDQCEESESGDQRQFSFQDCKQVFEKQPGSVQPDPEASPARSLLDGLVMTDDEDEEEDSRCPANDEEDGLGGSTDEEDGLAMTDDEDDGVKSEPSAMSEKPCNDADGDPFLLNGNDNDARAELAPSLSSDVQVVEHTTPGKAEPLAFEIFGSKGWTTLDRTASKAINAALEHGKKSCEYEVHSTRYLFDVRSMQQTNLATGNLRLIRISGSTPNSAEEIERMLTERMEATRNLKNHIERDRSAFIRQEDRSSQELRARTTSPCVRRNSLTLTRSALKKTKSGRRSGQFPRVRFEDDPEKTCSGTGGSTERRTSDVSDASCASDDKAEPRGRSRSEAAGSFAKSAAKGGGLGLAAGVAGGGAFGVMLAPFTFGLSIPIGLFVGGTTGTTAGTVAGAGYHAMS